MDTGLIVDLTDEQVEFRDVIGRFLADHSDPAAQRAAVTTPVGYDEQVWRRLGTEFGLPGLLIPERYGGLGLSFVDLAVVMEVLGRTLHPSPYLASAVLATITLLEAGDEGVLKEYLPDIAAGTVVATLAHRAVDVTAAAGPDGAAGEAFRLSGTVQHVLAGDVADLLILPAGTNGGASLFLVSGGAPGLRAERVPTVDQTRSQARLELSDVPARLIGADHAAGPVLDRVHDLAAVALAAEAVGGAAQCLADCVAYAKTRVQFGQPIGAFQAVKHRLADRYVEVEAARSTAYYTAWTAAEHAAGRPVSGGAELAAMAPAAQAYCASVYRRTAAENIQLHGGIGFTWEHEAHRYFKRATCDDLLFGSARYQRALLGERIGLVARPT